MRQMNQINRMNQNSPITKNILVTGYGTVGREFTSLLLRQAEMMERQYGVRFRIVGIAGSAGCLYEPGGIHIEVLLEYGTGSNALLRYAHARGIQLIDLQDISTGCLVRQAMADVLVEATPTSISHGEPALTYIMQAINRGMDVVAISKGALVTHYARIMASAETNRVRIKYSGATAAALPTLDIGEYSLAGCSINRIEGILNGTTNYILTCMQEQHIPFDEALQQAKMQGIAETNPDLDVKGFDSACKIVLLANGLLGTDYSLSDVRIEGIEGVTTEAVEAAKRKGLKIKLLASAYSDEEAGIRLEVSPRGIAPSHPLASVDRTEKGIVFHTDLMGTVCAIGGASSPTGAAAAAWKDLINLFR